MKYVAYFDPSGTSAPFGRGFLHIEETGLVVEARFLQFYLPAIVAKYIRKVVSTPSQRTIPYSTILQYKRTRFFDPVRHHLQYRLPDGKKRHLRFKLVGRREVGERFSVEIEQGRTLARAYLQT
jgi:hypothetical protein